MHAQAWEVLEQFVNLCNRWGDGPLHQEMSARPLPDGRYPPKGGGDYYRHLRLIAHRVNTPRLIVHVTELGEHRWLLKRLPHRFTEK